MQKLFAIPLVMAALGFSTITATARTIHEPSHANSHSTRHNLAYPVVCGNIVAATETNICRTSNAPKSRNIVSNARKSRNIPDMANDGDKSYEMIHWRVSKPQVIPSPPPNIRSLDDPIYCMVICERK
jgi:hypothetical protein